MSDETRDEGGSVFGNLPDSRPGSRSPRRDSARAKRSGAAGKPRSKAGAKATPRSAKAPRASTKRAAAAPRPKPEPVADAPARPEPSEPERPEPPEAESGGGLDDLAWAGVAAAAEAATFGVRLANRAFEALRGAAERR